MPLTSLRDDHDGGQAVSHQRRQALTRRVCAHNAHALDLNSAPQSIVCLGSTRCAPTRKQRDHRCQLRLGLHVQKEQREVEVLGRLNRKSTSQKHCREAFLKIYIAATLTVDLPNLMLLPRSPHHCKPSSRSWTGMMNRHYQDSIYMELRSTILRLRRHRPSSADKAAFTEMKWTTAIDALTAPELPSPSSAMLLPPAKLVEPPRGAYKYSKCKRAAYLRPIRRRTSLTALMQVKPTPL